MIGCTARDVTTWRWRYIGISEQEETVYVASARVSGNFGRSRGYCQQLQVGSQLSLRRSWLIAPRGPGGCGAEIGEGHFLRSHIISNVMAIRTSSFSVRSWQTEWWVPRSVWRKWNEEPARQPSTEPKKHFTKILAVSLVGRSLPNLQISSKFKACFCWNRIF